ncbi:hypothetical protein [Sphaerimonospora mesophila]|uniref:hypothetical protein n=1 Tax=Sphaerimonospora mesophila TaxID=37483 RepID=UPI0006E225AB
MDKILYYQYEDGSVSKREIPPPPGAVEITREAYESVLNSIEAKTAAHRQQLLDAERERFTTSVAQLMRLGMDEATARQILGVPNDVELPGLADLLNALAGGGE